MERPGERLGFLLGLSLRLFAGLSLRFFAGLSRRLFAGLSRRFFAGLSFRLFAGLSLRFFASFSLRLGASTALLFLALPLLRFLAGPGLAVAGERLGFAQLEHARVVPFGVVEVRNRVPGRGLPRHHDHIATRNASIALVEIGRCTSSDRLHRGFDERQRLKGFGVIEFYDEKLVLGALAGGEQARQPKDVAATEVVRLTEHEQRRATHPIGGRRQQR